MTNLSTFTKPAQVRSRRYGKHGIDRAEYLSRTYEFAHNANRKLTEEAVRAIRAEYRPWCKNNGCKAIAERYGVHPNSVLKIIRRETWWNLK